MLLCVPPASAQTPSASFWLSTLTGASVAVRTASGTGMVVTGTSLHV
jgi:hypothetical protein